MKKENFLSQLKNLIAGTLCGLKKVFTLTATAIIAVVMVSCQGDRNSQMAPENTLDGDKVAGLITEQEAKEIADRFTKLNGLRSATNTDLSSSLVYTEPTELRAGGNNEFSGKPAYYIFNLVNPDKEAEGYVLVSASDATYPVIGYSHEGGFNAENIPLGMSAMLADYADEVKYAWKHLKSDEFTKEWRELSLESVKLNGTRAEVVVEPLLGDIKWDQSPYYNDSCPRLSPKVKRSPVGCVATATSQIMRYWEYPAKGKGKHRSTGYPRLLTKFDFDLKWENMPKETLTKPNEDIARFCYAVAVGLNMRFGVKESGTLHDRIPTLLTENFSYQNTARQVFRNNYTTEDWVQMLVDELDAGRPVQYAGRGKGGGHSFVCDGYADNGYFHFNWGWGGIADGYFLTGALNPLDLGTGGGTGGFNYGQEAIIGIQPPEDEEEKPEEEIEPEVKPTSKYCESTALNSRSTWIKGVAIANMSNLTKSGEGGYNYFKNKTVKLNADRNYEITLLPGFQYGTYKMNWAVWIDFNGNGNFEAEEQVTQFLTKTADAVTKSIAIPANAKLDTPLRMRVAMKWGGAPYPCEKFNHGEVEDYDVIITDPSKPTPTPEPQPQPEPTPIPTPQHVYPTSYAKDSYYGYIGQIFFNRDSWTNYRGVGYSDLTEEWYFELKAYLSNTMKLVPAFGTNKAYNCYWRVWIDANNDGKFTYDELLFSRNGYSTINSSFAMKYQYKPGNYRMRVSMKVAEGYPNSDEIFNYGAVQDFAVRVI